ncbi:lithostathine-like [Suncus etruscus]|uniref:lithostathine-like n=1 Tax=Suncus etruscus TaxID=109475 RepID=UPI002110E0D9|nr:lithostathine-like [Suncus etruscus]
MLPPMIFPTVAWMLLSCVMLQYQVTGEDLQKGEISPRISCPKGSLAYGSHCYALFFAEKSWMDADYACQKRPKGHLVSVLTGSEAYFVASLIKNSGTSVSHIWIGLHDPTEGRQPNGGGWEWISNDVLNYVAWDKGAPTDAGYCGSLVQSTGYEKWHSQDCRKPLPYVCKFQG